MFRRVRRTSFVRHAAELSLWQNEQHQPCSPRHSWMSQLQLQQINPMKKACQCSCRNRPAEPDELGVPAARTHLPQLRPLLLQASCSSSNPNRRLCRVLQVYRASLHPGGEGRSICIAEAEADPIRLIIDLFAAAALLLCCRQAPSDCDRRTSHLRQLHPCPSKQTPNPKP